MLDAWSAETDEVADADLADVGAHFAEITGALGVEGEVVDVAVGHRVTSMLLFKITFKQSHLFGFCLLCYVDVWLHCAVVGVAGPLHYYLWRDAAGQCEADEGTTAGVGAYEFVFRFGFFYSLPGTIEDRCDGFVYLAQFAEVLQIVVHFLIGDDRKGEVAGKFAVFVFIKDGLGE